MVQRTRSPRAASTSGRCTRCLLFSVFLFPVKAAFQEPLPISGAWVSLRACHPQLYLGFAPGAEARPPPVPSGLLPAVPPPLQTVGTKASSHCLLVGSKRSRIFVSWLQKGILKTLRDPNNVTCIILMPEVMKTQTHDFLASLHVIGAAVPEDIYICPVGEVGIPPHGSAGSSRLRVQRGHLGGPKWPRGE